MGKDGCEIHRIEMTLIEQIDKNVTTTMETVAKINDRVRETEKINAAQGVKIENNKDSIKNIKRIIWTTVLAIIGTLGTWVSKLLGFTGK